MPVVESKTFPHFLGIGAQKAGTSWIFECLKKHPEIWLPPEKEIHYFDRHPHYPSPSFLYPDQPILRFFGSTKDNKAFRIRLRDSIKCNFKNRDVLKWYLNYFLRVPTDDWYASLFKDGRDLIRGEITPAYAMLDQQDVDHIGVLMPAAKIIFIMRNPVDRAWSNFRFLKLKADTLSEFKSWADSDHQERRSDYLNTLSIWSKVFRKEQMFCGFYDDIERQPEVLLRQILTHIGASTDHTIIDSILVKGRVNVSPEVEMPSDFRKYLQEKYEREINIYAEELGGCAKQWAKEALVP